MLVVKSVTISGPDILTLTVDGNAMSRMFRIGLGKTVSIWGLTLTNGSTGSENGGGILNDHAILTIDSCAVQNSSAQPNRGGGVYNDGSAGSATLTVLNSTVSGNYAYSAGGGIYNRGWWQRDIDDYEQHRWMATVASMAFPSWRRGGGVFNDGRHRGRSLIAS